MNKKFLSAILCGAMLVTALGTFVSCKDYDDDIESLQSQIDGLTSSTSSDVSSLQSNLSSIQASLQSSLSSTESSLQSQITAAQNTLQDAINAKADASELSALSSSVASLQTDLAGAQASYDEQISAAQSAITALQTSSTTVEEQLADLQKTVSSNDEAVNNAIDELTKSTGETTDKLQAALDALEKSSESTSQQFAADIDSLYEAITNAQTTIAVLEGAYSDISSIASDTESLKQAMAAAELNLDMQKAALQTFDSTMVSMQQDIANLMQYMDPDASQKYEDMSDNITALDTKIDSISDAIANAGYATLTDLQTDMQKLYEYISDNFTPDLSNITVLVRTAVTGIELVYSYASQANYAGTDLVFQNAIEKTTVFGEGLEGEITFEDGKLYKKTASLLVRVSPISASLDPDMIRFVNSKGEVLEGIVKIDSVARYDKLLTKAAVETGLWTITLEVEDGLTSTLFSNKTETSDGKILFAVQVNSTLNEDGLEDRYVTSTYDVTMTWKDYSPAKELYFNVDKTPVASIANRYKGEVGTTFWETDPYTDVTREELYWYTTDPDKYPIPEIKENITKNNTDVDDGDDRHDEELFDASNTVAFTVSLKEDKDGKIDAENIRAMYVTLDYKDFAVESQNSEWVAWNAYNIEGLNKVVEGTSTEITINDVEAKSDIIGFRVFAVNYDGTLVDPDGKAFYVEVDKQDTNWGKLATTIIPEDGTIITTTSDTLDLDLSNVSLKRAYSMTWSTDQIDGKAATAASTAIFNIVMTDKKGNVVAYTRDNTLYYIDESATNNPGVPATSATDLTSVTNVYTTIVDDNWPSRSTFTSLDAWTAYLDGQTYTGTLTITNSAGRTIGSLTVTMKKELPTDMLYDATVKTNQLYNGTYYAFMVPYDDDPYTNASANAWPKADETADGDGDSEADGITALYGAMEMKSVFNFDDEATDIDKYVIDWGTSDENSSGKLVSKSVTGSETLSVDYTYVDDTATHTVSVGWNYGDISSDTSKNPYVVTGYTFPAIYVCLYNEDAYTWDWRRNDDGTIYGDRNLLTYNTAKTIMLSVIKGTSLKDGTYNGTAAEGYDGTLVITEGHLITSDNDRVDEYFTVDISNGTQAEFTPVSSATNPNYEVDCTLVLTGIDCYGHTVTIKVPMIVQRS